MSAWTLKPTKIDVKSNVASDIEIARSIFGKDINQLCKEINISSYDLYGSKKAKITKLAGELDPATRGSYVVVTGITPTSYGEGKSTTTIGLVQSLTAHLNKNSIACIRQPSQGPTFGLKGGAAGGGYSQVWPMDEFNLHLTGDIHAITAANNLIAAAIDARHFHETTQNDEDLFRRLVTKPGSKSQSFTEAQRRRLAKLNINQNAKPDDLSTIEKRKFARLNFDVETITFNRVIDTNDRFLRKITIGQSATEKFKTRQTKFDIAVASELMAILALANNMQDVEQRVRQIIVGFSKPSEDTNNKSVPITCDDLCISGAVLALVKDAIYPTLMQTLEGTPVLVHCGPFANVAHGNSSIIADKLALELVGRDGFVVTEAGFASDVGFEKFMDIKCRASGLLPDCAVLVTTLRAIKQHGIELIQQKNKNDTNIEQSTGDEYEVLNHGLVNTYAHIKNITENFGVKVVVALNKFINDSSTELEYVKSKAFEAGATACCVTDNWAKGGAGAVDLAKQLIQTCESSRKSNATTAHLLYESSSNLSIKDKISIITSKVYGANEVTYSQQVDEKIKLLEESGFGHLPLCIAKTHLSISHDSKLKGAPKDYTFPIVGINVSAGAGFLYALAGEISTMPGLPTRPAFFDITVDTITGQVDGLF